MPLIQRLGVRGLLSFPPKMEPFDLLPLNVLIGPNGSGKSNLIEVIELLHAAPVNLGKAIQTGGGIEEWIWKGDKDSKARIAVRLEESLWVKHPIIYQLTFQDVVGMLYITDEKITEIMKKDDGKNPNLIYQLNDGSPVIYAKNSDSSDQRVGRDVERETITRTESILSQIKEPSVYPELFWLNSRFLGIVAFREWTFGARSDLRLPQRVDDPSDALLPDARNLALVINEIHHRDHRAFDAAMKRFLPRYERISTRIVGGTIQLFLHESGLSAPIPTTRISDGTLRFLAMLAVLLSPRPPSLLCFEEPELGLHPDAISLMGELLLDASQKMQLVITTHSDALLSALGNQVESVLVCENNGHGTTIERLDAERLTYWLKDYTLGDIWRIGEIGGNP